MNDRDKIKDVVCYCRVSTDEQTTENQRLRLSEFCERQGWNYKIIEEVESSRKTRPRKNAVYQGLLKREWDAVVVYKMDRWARSLQELVTDMTTMYERNVYFISFSENIDMSTAAGKLQTHILAAFADFERSIISERTKEGLARAKAQGKTLGRPKGSNDKKRRRKSGYHLRWSGEKI